MLKASLSNVLTVAIFSQRKDKMGNKKQLPFWQGLLLIALIMSAITFFSGLGLILAKILYHFFTNGKIQPLANYILREEPWDFGWYMALIFLVKHTTITIGDAHK